MFSPGVVPELQGKPPHFRHSIRVNSSSSPPNWSPDTPLLFASQSRIPKKNVTAEAPALDQRETDTRRCFYHRSAGATPAIRGAGPAARLSASGSGRVAVGAVPACLTRAAPRQEPAPSGRETAMLAALHDASYSPARVRSRMGRGLSPYQQLSLTGGEAGDIYAGSCSVCRGPRPPAPPLSHRVRLPPGPISRWRYPTIRGMGFSPLTIPSRLWEIRNSSSWLLA